MAKQSALGAALRSTKAARPPAPAAAARPVPPAADATAFDVQRPKAPVPPSRVGTKAITVHFSSDVRRQLKSLAADLELDVQDLVAEGLNLVFAKYGRPEIAPEPGKPGR